MSFAAAHACDQAAAVQSDDPAAVDRGRGGACQRYVTAAKRNATFSHRSTVDLDIEPPAGGPLKLVAILTATKPGPGPEPCLMLPERLTSKGPFSALDCELGLLAFTLVVCAAGEEELGALEASSVTGVPERRAQPCPSGPPGSHRTRAIGPIAVSASAPPRTRRCSGQPGSVRAQTAIATAIDAQSR